MIYSIHSTILNMMNNTIFNEYEKYKAVNLEAAVAFLLARDWTLEEKNEKYIILKSPDYMQFKYENCISLPLASLKNELSYGLYMNNLINRVAQIYEIEKTEIFRIWTKSTELLKKETESSILAMELLKKSA